MEVSLGFLQYEEDGTDALAFGIGFPLPIFDRNQGGITAAKYELAKAEMEMVSIQTAMSVELEEIYAGLVTAHKKATILREKVLPASEKAFNAASEGYKQGKFGYIDVLDAQRSLFDARAEVIDALTDYHESFVELEQLTGTALGKLDQNNGEE